MHIFGVAGGWTGGPTHSQMNERHKRVRGLSTIHSKRDAKLWLESVRRTFAFLLHTTFSFLWS